MKQSNNNGFSLVVVLMAICVAGLLGFVGYYVYAQQTKKSDDKTATLSQTEDTVKSEFKKFDRPSDVALGKDFEIELDGVKYYTVTGIISTYDASNYTTQQDDEVAKDLTKISSALEKYYEKNGMYPKLDQVTTTDWAEKNLDLKYDDLLDPMGYVINVTSGNYWYSSLDDLCNGSGCRNYELNAQTSKGLYSKKALNFHP